MKGPEVFDICDGTRRLEGNTLWPPKEINAMLLLDGHLKVCEVDTNFLLRNNTCMWASDTVRYCEVIHTRARIQNTGTHPLHAFHRALLDVCRSSVLLLVATVEQIQLTPSMHACPLFQFANDLISFKIHHIFPKVHHIVCSIPERLGRVVNMPTSCEETHIYSGPKGESIELSDVS